MSFPEQSDRNLRRLHDDLKNQKSKIKNKTKPDMNVTKRSFTGELLMAIDENNVRGVFAGRDCRRRRHLFNSLSS